MRGFEEIRDTLPKKVAQGFVKEVEAWEKDQRQPNPYQLPKRGVSPVYDQQNKY